MFCMSVVTSFSYGGQDCGVREGLRYLSVTNNCYVYVREISPNRNLSIDGGRVPSRYAISSRLFPAERIAEFGTSPVGRRNMLTC